jgi:hypothetical protein
VRATFEEKQLSQAELQELRRGLKGSPAEARLRTLLANDQGKKTKGASRSLAALEARKKELDTQRVKLRSQKRNQAETMLVRAKARLPSAGRTIRDRTSSALAPPRPPAEGAPGRITSVSPSPVRIGTSLVISGSEFGAAQGRVGVYVGRDLEYCDIASWSDGRITATLTESIAARVGESEASGFVWVKPNGYDTGPSEEIRIQPDPDSLIPRIDRLSDDTVEPGLLLVIEGSHFLSERNGTVQMRLESGESFDLSITEWTDGYVAGTFEDISGVVGGTALLTLRNHAGQEATRSVTFQPHLVLRTFRFPPNTVHCEAWMSGTDRGGPLCFVGQKETSSSHSLFLDDGWEIIDFYVEEIDSLGWTGWEITRAPLLNRTGVHFDFDVEIWAEMYSTIQVRPVAVGQGPSGVDLWPMYR